MKLLIVIPTLQKGGAERVVSVLTSEWLKNNDVKVLVFDKKNVSYDINAEIIDLKLPALNGIFLKAVQLLRRATSLLKFFKKDKPDRIISFMESANFPSLIAAFLSKKLEITWVTCHVELSLLTKIQYLLIPYIYKHAKKIITVSKGLRDELIKMGIKKEKLKVIYNPLSTFAPAKDKFLPKPLKAPQKYILGVGRLDYQKGFDILIDAFKKIEDKSLYLVILGEGDEKNNLLRIIKNKKLSDRVHLIGVAEDIWPWYRFAECFVLSSRSEPFGLVMIEAMSQGCPVVAFDCNYGPREIITHKKNGLLVKKNDSEELFKSIKKLLLENNLRNKLKFNGTLKSHNFEAKILSKQWLIDN